MIAGQLGQDCAGPVQLGPVARADLKDLLTNFRLQFLGVPWPMTWLWSMMARCSQPAGRPPPTTE